MPRVGWSKRTMSVSRRRWEATLRRRRSETVRRQTRVCRTGSSPRSVIKASICGEQQKKEIKNCATTREYERKVLQRMNKRFGQNKEQNCVPPFLLPPTEVRVRIDHVSIGPSDSPGLSQDLVNHWTFSIDDYSPLWVRYTFILLYNSNWVVLRPQTSPNEAGNIEIRKLLKLAPAALLHNWRVELTQR